MEQPTTDNREELTAWAADAIRQLPPAEQYKALAYLFKLLADQEEKATP